MKKFTIIAIFCLSLLSCENKTVGNQRVVAEEEVNMVQLSNIRSEELGEFDYKGHTYIYSTVRDGIGLTHAGHCKCQNGQ